MHASASFAYSGDDSPAAAHRALSDDLAGAGKALADAAAARYGATLARFAEEARARGASAVSTAVLRGDVAGLAGPMAVDYAASNGCDVAVVGSRGLGAFKRYAPAMTDECGIALVRRASEPRFGRAAGACCRRWAWAA